MKFDRDPTHILKAVYDNFLSKTKTIVSCYASVMSAMQQHRDWKFPANLSNFETVMTKKRATSTDGKHLIKIDKKKGIVIIATGKSLKLSEKNSTMLCDGNFKCCFPHTSNSMYFWSNFYKFKGNRLFSVFSVVRRRSSTGYCRKKLAKKIEISGIPKEAKIVFTDYERAISSTMEASFTTWTH